jgi:hypothetical protein
MQGGLFSEKTPFFPRGERVFWGSSQLRGGRGLSLLCQSDAANVSPGGPCLRHTSSKVLTAAAVMLPACPAAQCPLPAARCAYAPPSSTPSPSRCVSYTPLPPSSGEASAAAAAVVALPAPYRTHRSFCGHFAPQCGCTRAFHSFRQTHCCCSAVPAVELSLLTNLGKIARHQIALARPPLASGRPVSAKAALHCTTREHQRRATVFERHRSPHRV